MLVRHLKAVKSTYIIHVSRFIQTEYSPYIKKSEHVTPCFKNILNIARKTAVCDNIGTHTYASIFLSAKELAREISTRIGGRTDERVLFMCPNNVNYVITLWAIWMSGQVAVPLSPLHPQNLLLYYTNDAKPKLIVTSPEFKEATHKIATGTHTQLIVLDEKLSTNNLDLSQNKENDLDGGFPEPFYDKSNALILYTSGTTGNPKGVVLSHRNLSSQVNSLLDAWKWTTNDALLHTLPLNHVHGIVNALLCPLTVGAKIVMLPKFDANSVWSNLLGINGKINDHKINVYMAVPSIYSQLIEEYEKIFSGDEKMKQYIKNYLKSKIRLMISGSASLPEPVFKKWLELSGHLLLERYGMTEIGMCFSNPYDGERIPGYVGNPLPGVSVKITQKNEAGNFVSLVESHNDNSKIIVNVNVSDKENPSGYLLVKSDSVFKEYFNRPEATNKEFTSDGYFITGDVSQFDIKQNSFKILGRESVDIIKSGGYKLSAPQIETQLLSNADIKECVIVGLPDEKWGEKVAAIIVLNKGKGLTLKELRIWATDKLPKYATPTVLKIVETIPKNTMGKINKKELVKNLF